MNVDFFRLSATIIVVMTAMNKIFSKDKDWVLLISYVGLIYGTLQFMPIIPSLLLGQYFNIVTNTFIGVIIMAMLIIVVKRNIRRAGPVSYIFMTAVFGSYAAILLFATPIIVEKLHLLEYGFLAYLALRAVRGLRFRFFINSEARQSLCAILIVIIVGCCDELIQKFTPGRYCQLSDIILNIISGILGLSILKLLTPKHYR